MPRKNFVREIKVENIKDINPYDIIYLALKDGSIVLIVDNDEETIDYEDIKSEMSYSQRRRNMNFYNNQNVKKHKTISSNTNTNDSENINLQTKYSYYSKDKIKNNNKPVIISNKNKNENFNNRNNEIKYIKYNREQDIMNKSFNYERKSFNSEFNKSNYDNGKNYYKNEGLEKSFDNTKNYNNNYVHKIEYINNNPQRPKSTRPSNNNINTNQDYRKNTNTTERRVIITPQDPHRTPKRDEKKPVYKNKNNNHLINISGDRSINYGDNSFMNKTQLIENKNIYKDYFNNNNNNKNNVNVIKKVNINTFNRGQPIRSQSVSSNRTIETPKPYYVKRREMEIMGRIVNDDDSYRLIDHKHPNTLFEPKCPHCQNLARKNKLCISNIKEESIYDNHSFLAIFGESGSKRGKSHSNFYKAV